MVLRGLKHLWGGRAEAPSGQAASDQDLALIDYLISQISAPNKAQQMLSAAAAFRKQSATARQKALPGLYLLLEQYLTHIDPVRRVKVGALRKTVRERFPDLLGDEAFGLILQAPDRQEVLLCRRLLLGALDHSTMLLGAAGANTLKDVRAWLEKLLGDVALPIPFHLAEEAPTTDPQLVDLLVQVSAALYHFLRQRLGEAADRVYDGCYRSLADRYTRLDTFPVVIRLLPDALLDGEKMLLVSHNAALEDRESRLELVNHELRTRNRELNRTQQELRIAKQEALVAATQFQAVLDAAGDGIITFEATGEIVLVNPEVTHLWGYAQENLVGTSLKRLIPLLFAGDEGPRHPALAEQLGQPVEMEGVRMDGTRFQLEMKTAETPLAHRPLFTAVVRDITDRKQFEENLIAARENAEELARLRSTFLANMSHEIRTPLTGIIGFADLLVSELKEDHLEFAEIIKGHGNRLLETLDSVLDLIRLESDQVQPVYESLDVLAQARETSGLFSPLVQSKGLSLNVTSPASDVLARLDRGFLIRILNNLISNAVKFTEQGEVDVRVAHKGTDVVLEVQDTGVGIHEEFLPHLFDEFQQESTGLSRSHEGTGLGLTITRQLVDLLGGQITVTSQPGVGSCFTVRLPQAPTGEAVPPGATASSPVAHPEGDRAGVRRQKGADVRNREEAAR